MSPFSRNSLIVTCLLALTVAMLLKIHAASAKVPQDLVDLSVVPYEIDSWKGEDIPIDQSVYEILETEDILSRRYFDESGYSLALLIICAENNRDSFHPPEICYVGSGVQLIDKGAETLNLNDGSLLDTTTFAVKADTYTSKVWYWFMVGDKIIADHYWQQLHMLKEMFSKDQVQGAMIRISVDGNDELGKEKASQFVSGLIPHLDDIY